MTTQAERIAAIRERHDGYYLPERNTLQGGVDAHKDRGELLDMLTKVADGIETLIDKYLDPDGTLRIDESELLAITGERNE